MYSMAMADVKLYEAIYKRKWVQGYKWKHIAEALDFDIGSDGMQVKYRRLAEKLELPYKPPSASPKASKQSTESNTPSSILMSSNQLPEPKSVKDMTDIEIFRIKYEELAPTLYVSELSNDDWIDKYMVYPYESNEPDFIEQMKKEWRQPYLTELRNKIWNMQELLALLPRGYGKTESVIALFVRWILEVRKPLMIITPKRTHSKKIMRAIERALKRPSVRRDYGDISSSITFGSDGMILDYSEEIEWKHLDYPVEIYTFSSIKEGAHPAWVHFEDVMQVEFKNLDSNEDLKEKHTNTIIPMLGRDGKFTATGTRYGMDDFYSWLMTDQGIPLYHKRALNEDGTWLYCPRYSLEYLLMRREKMPAAFETQMNNNPVPSTGLYFDRDHWVDVDIKDMPYYTNITYYIVVDPARGMSEGADNTAILVVGISNGIAYVVNGFIGKIDDDEKVKKINELHAKYNPAFTLIEKVFAQIDMRKFRHLRGIQGYQDTSRNAKIVRISAMKSYFKDGLIKIAKDIQPYDFLLNEYLQYVETASTTTRKDDAIDCLSIFIQQYGHLLDIYDDTEDDWNSIPSEHLHLRGNSW